jgi:hypothetical protein
VPIIQRNEADEELCASDDSGISKDDDSAIEDDVSTEISLGYRIGSDVPPSPQATRNRQINEKKQAYLNINILQKILITKYYSTFFVNSNGIFSTESSTTNSRVAKKSIWQKSVSCSVRLHSSPKL